MDGMNPIENIEWIDVDSIEANDYNPNVVMNQELKLLEFSIVKNGWIQPILVNQEAGQTGFTIIDGFHRYTLAKQSKTLRERDKGKAPCVIMRLPEAERMLLTIRINRAKGTHVSYRMSDIIKKLINEYNLDPKYIGQSIGATKAEIDLLMMEDVFKKLDIQNHKYSKAWYPKYD
ncbi:ParB-like nuclease domain protein [Bacillus phage 035JT001]|nr:ParB-like nuclease domain protein [Bacillus phage 035JT001]